MEDEKDGGRWQTSALEQEEWFGPIEDGVAWFMRKCHAREAEASAKRQLARAGAAAAAENVVSTGPKRKRSPAPTLAAVVAVAATAENAAPRRPKRTRAGAAAVAAAEKVAPPGSQSRRETEGHGRGKEAGNCRGSG